MYVGKDISVLWFLHARRAGYNPGLGLLFAETAHKAPASVFACASPYVCVCVSVSVCVLVYMCLRVLVFACSGLCVCVFVCSGVSLCVVLGRLG